MTQIVTQFDKKTIRILPFFTALRLIKPAKFC